MKKIAFLFWGHFWECLSPTSLFPGYAPAFFAAAAVAIAVDVVVAAVVVAAAVDYFVPRSLPVASIYFYCSKS